MYMEGRGVQQDDVIAHMWLNLGASRLTGDTRERAVKARDQIALRMTADQRAEAQRRAREWKPVFER
jgi:hypothetical protein